MRNAVKAFAPHSPIGWIAVTLGLGVAVDGLLLYYVSDAVTNGGSESAPLWLHVLVPVAVLAVAIPAVIVGFRSRRTDPSTLGTIALAVAGVLGGWSAFTGVAGFFL